MKSLKNGEYTYSESDFLGEGSFAKVYKGVIVKTSRVIAVRLLPLKLIKQYGNKIKNIINGQVEVLKLLSEIDDAYGLFTTKIYDCFLTDHNVVMILQFCPDGNLEDIVAKRGPLNEKEALQIAYQLALGLNFISKRKVIHRDIKPDNVFIRKDGNETLYKLGDFGFAVKQQINEQIVGTPIFMSPELFRQQPYGSQVDVWAYGLLVHYLLFKQHYFIQNTQNKVKAKVLNSRYKLQNHHLQRISPLTAQLLKGCLEFDKNKRLKAENLAFNPAFNPVKSKVQNTIRCIQKTSRVYESKLRKQTAKGKFVSKIMSYNFIYELGMYLGKRHNMNLASLYLFKYALSELNNLKTRAQNNQNVISHLQWNDFTKTQQFSNSFKIIDNLLQVFSATFQNYYNSVLGPMFQQRPDIVNGIVSNLGNGPTALINPAIPSYELKNNWLTKLGTSPQDYLIKLQIMIAVTLIEGKQIDLDFYGLQVQKKTATINEIVQQYENAIKTVK